MRPSRRHGKFRTYKRNDLTNDALDSSSSIQKEFSPAENFVYMASWASGSTTASLSDTMTQQRLHLEMDTSTHYILLCVALRRRTNLLVSSPDLRIRTHFTIPISGVGQPSERILSRVWIRGNLGPDRSQCRSWLNLTLKQNEPGLANKLRDSLRT